MLRVNLLGRVARPRFWAMRGFDSPGFLMPRIPREHVQTVAGLQKAIRLSAKSLVPRISGRHATFAKRILSARGAWGRGHAFHGNQYTKVAGTIRKTLHSTKFRTGRSGGAQLLKGIFGRRRRR